MLLTYINMAIKSEPFVVLVLAFGRPAAVQPVQPRRLGAAGQGGLQTALTDKGCVERSTRLQ